MPTLIHHPALAFAAFLSLVAVTFTIDRLGLLAWMAWLGRHEGKPKNKVAKKYWTVQP
jgi:hypothetical protein